MQELRGESWDNLLGASLSADLLVNIAIKSRMHGLWSNMTVRQGLYWLANKLLVKYSAFILIFQAKTYQLWLNNFCVIAKVYETFLLHVTKSPS